MGAYAPLPWAPPGLADEVMATVVEPAAGRAGRPRHALQRPAVHRPVPDLAAARGSSSSTLGSATRRPRSCWTGSARRSAACWQAAADGDLGRRRPAAWRAGAAVTVVIAAEGYPAAPAAGDVIDGRRGGRRRSPAPTSCTRGRRPGGRAAHDRGRAGAQRGGHRPRPGRSPGGRLRGGRADPDARRLVPRRHRGQARGGHQLPGHDHAAPGHDRRRRPAPGGRVPAASADPADGRRAAAGQHPGALLRPGLRLHPDPAHRACWPAGCPGWRWPRCCWSSACCGGCTGATPG